MIQVFSSKKDKPRAYPFLLPAQTGLGSKKYYSYDPIEYSISADGKKWISCFDISDIEGVNCFKAPDVQPAVQTDNLQKVGLMDGSRLLSTSYSTRELKMELLFQGIEEPDAQLAYDAIQRFLVARDPYWICFSNWPQRMYYVKAKLASLSSIGDRNWTCEVTFTDLIGLSRSVGSTQDPVLGFGNNLTQMPKYMFKTNNFTLINNSDVLIDPERRGHPFKMTLNGSSSGHLSVKNNTTGDEISKKSAFSGNFVLNGVNPELNGQGDFLDTDGGIITLKTGPNNFSVSNFSGTISFDYPDWWLS